MGLDTPQFGESYESKTLPPPPPEGDLEVTIRTLASDLELIKKNGGVFSTSGAGALVSVTRQGEVKAQGPGDASSQAKNSMALIWTIVFIVGAVVLFAVGYYLIPLVLNDVGAGPAGNNLASDTARTETPSNTQPANSQSVTVAAHMSFLKTPTQAVDLNLYEGNLAPDRAVLIRQAEIQAPTENGAFFEIIPHGPKNKPLPWTDLFALLGVSGLDNTFLTKHFMSDYTMVAVRSGNRLYPAYIFKLKDGENPLLLQRDALAFEAPTQAFEALFLLEPGTPSASFKDTQISGQPTRTLTFSSGGNKLEYGWFFEKYFIMSTTEAGLKTVIERL